MVKCNLGPEQKQKCLLRLNTDGCGQNGQAEDSEG